MAGPGGRTWRDLLIGTSGWMRLRGEKIGGFTPFQLGRDQLIACQVLPPGGRGVHTLALGRRPRNGPKLNFCIGIKCDHCRTATGYSSVRVLHSTKILVDHYS
eukprot:1539107-Prymnesium_polylepis.1